MPGDAGRHYGETLSAEELRGLWAASARVIGWGAFDGVSGILRLSAPTGQRCSDRVDSEV